MTFPAPFEARRAHWCVSSRISCCSSRCRCARQRHARQHADDLPLTNRRATGARAARDGRSGCGALPCAGPGADAAVLQQREPEPRAARPARERLAAQLLITRDITTLARHGSSIALLSRTISTRERPLDRAAVDPDPEPLSDQLDKIR